MTFGKDLFAIFRRTKSEAPRETAQGGTDAFALRLQRLKLREKAVPVRPVLFRNRPALLEA